MRRKIRYGFSQWFQFSSHWFNKCIFCKFFLQIIQNFPFSFSNFLLLNEKFFLMKSSSLFYLFQKLLNLTVYFTFSKRFKTFKAISSDSLLENKKLFDFKNDNIFQITFLHSWSLHCFSSTKLCDRFEMQKRKQKQVTTPSSRNIVQKFQSFRWPFLQMGMLLFLQEFRTTNRYKIRLLVPLCKTRQMKIFWMIHLRITQCMGIGRRFETYDKHNIKLVGSLELLQILIHV